MEKLVIALVMACTAPIPDVLGGGAERLVTMLIDQNEIEQKVQFVVFSKRNMKAKKISKKYKHSKFIYLCPFSILDKVINVCGKKRQKYTGRVTPKRGYYYKIANRLERNHVDFIVDENGYVPDVQYLTNRVGKEKVSAHIHWMVKPKERNIEHIYGSAIGVSKFITNIWGNYITDNTILKTVYSAVDEKRFTRRITSEKRDILRQELGFKKNDCIFVYCGRMEASKGPAELLNAFMELQISNIGLLFVGGSDKKKTKNSEYYQKMIEQAKNDTRIKFTGYIDNDEIYKYYQLADVQVIPTITEEAAGLVAIEGMLSALPIIATNSGGMPEYLNKECAIIVGKGDKLKADLINSMSTLAMNREIRKKMSIESSKSARQYTQSKYYSNFIDAINEILREYTEKGKFKNYDRKKTIDN